MTEIQIKQDTTVPLDVTLPRDISSTADVTVHIEDDTTTTSVPAPITDASENTVAIPLDHITLAAGVHKIEFEIDYDTGYTETLPDDGYDYLHVYDDLD
jgi:hypothetical protein